LYHQASERISHYLVSAARM